MSKIIKPISKGALDSNESKDCVVRAAANATNRPYEAVLEVMATVGRKTGQGCSFDQIVKGFSILGLSLKGVCGTTQSAEIALRVAKRILGDVQQYKGITLEKFLKFYTKGNYVCTIKGHAFAVIDGKLIDKTALRGGSYITAFWKV
jgi:hypothetical protein